MHTMDLKAIAHTRQLHKHILVKVKHQQTFLHQAEFLLLTHPVFVNTFFLIFCRVYLCIHAFRFKLSLVSTTQR